VNAWRCRPSSRLAPGCNKVAHRSRSFASRPRKS
jgi:hypothetical protein